MLAVASHDVELARSALRSYYDQDLTEEQKAAAEIILDFDAEEMTCPGCLTTFATGPERCPECGLRFGA